MVEPVQRPAVDAGRIEPHGRRLRAVLGGAVLLDTTDARLRWEWPWYPRFHVHPADVDLTRLRPSPTTTVCPYKGTTGRWWSVVTPRGVHDDLAWSYEEPVAGLEAIRGRIAFYDERVDVTVDGVPRARPVTHLAG